MSEAHDVGQETLRLMKTIFDSNQNFRATNLSHEWSELDSLVYLLQLSLDQHLLYSRYPSKQDLRDAITRLLWMQRE